MTSARSGSTIAASRPTGVSPALLSRLSNTGCVRRIPGFPRRRLMIRRQWWVALALLLGTPALALAQATITGTVRDTSGAILPGVTVEAASPALIEKVRSVITDGSGQYRIEALRPGTYAVTFTLPGFSSVKREGIELTGSFVASVN